VNGSKGSIWRVPRAIGERPVFAHCGVHYVAVTGASRDRVLTLVRLAAAREPQDDVAVAFTRRAQRSEASTMAAEGQICHCRRVRAST